MAESEELGDNSSQDLLRRMSAEVDGVDKVIRFANDDVPAYLENLRRFHEESRKVQILVK